MKTNDTLSCSGPTHPDNTHQVPKKNIFPDLRSCNNFRVLSDIFHLDDHKTNLKTGIMMDLYYYTLQFARENSFTKEQTSAFFSIVKKTHEVCIGKI